MSSSLPPAFAADFFADNLGLEAFFLLAGSAAGVFGVDSLSLVAVLGVFAGYREHQSMSCGPHIPALIPSQFPHRCLLPSSASLSWA